MDVYLELFNELEHIEYIQNWEENKDLFSFLSHTRPKYLRDSDDTAKEKTLFYLIKLSDKYVGATWLEDITEEDAKLSIYVAEPECRGLGIGDKVIQQLIKRAFSELNLKSIYLNVRSNNERAIKCYMKNGFKVTEQYNNLILSNGETGVAYRMMLSRLRG